MSDDDIEPDDTERTDRSDARPDDGVGGPDAATDTDGTDRTDPVSPPDGQPGEPADGSVADEAFEPVAVDDIDTDGAWTDIAGQADDARGDPPATPDEDDPKGPEGTDDTVAVSKHAYCERCEFLSEAPEIRCTNEGTEIVEFIDMDTVRVSNCPIVAKRANLDDGSDGSTDIGDIQRE